ncbi:MAG: hypothetical protein ABI488_06715 [Polyangiaceae bacterium]
MQTLTRTEFLAKPEVKKALKNLKNAARGALPAASVAEREEAMLAIFEEAQRGLVEEELQGFADGFGELLLVDGVEYKQHEPGLVQYYCLGGTVRVRRYTHRRVDVRNGPTVVRLELVAGLAEGATPALAYNVLHGYGQHDMRQHGESLAAAHRVPPARATLERMAKRLANVAHEAAPRVVALVRQTERLPEGARAVCFGLDRTSVPMAEERPASAPAKPARKRRKPRKRRASKPIDVNFRMAYVGTVSIVDEHGEALVTRRYAAPACDDAATLVAKMTADVRAAVRRDPNLAVGTVQDGAPEMWTLTRAGLSKLRKQGVIAGGVEGIDRYHLLERLGAALELIEPNATERLRQLNDWNERLDAQDSAIDSIERHLESHYANLTSGKRDQLWEHLV